MPDPFETLRSQDAPVPPALPAAEVRRRGDRLRRRRTTLRAVGAACAVAVVITGGIALGEGRPDASPAPPVSTSTGGPSPDWTLGPSPDGPTPTGGQAQAVPDGFPLLAGVPEPDGDSTRKAAVTDPGTRSVLDPCHDNEQAAVERGRTDYREVTQQGPAHAYLREIAVYEDSSAAHEAVLLARGEIERCRVYAYDDGISRDVWETSAVTAADVDADQALVAVNHGYSDYGITTLATHWIVARVGNAVVSLGYDGEFGATASQVRAVAEEQLAGYEEIAPALCPFADQTTTIACEEASDASGPGPVTDPGPDYLLDEPTLRKLTGVDRFGTVPDSTAPTLPCQADWLSSLGADTADYRQFEARSGRGEGELAAWAGTAVLGFPDELTAGTAYDTVGEWLSQCEPQVDPSHRLVAVAGGGIGEPHITRRSDGISSWRAVKVTAPERCVECDAAWDDYEGLVWVGRKLVLLHVAYAGDMQLGLDDSRSPMAPLLGELGDRVAAAQDAGAAGTSGATFGPDGVAGVRLRAPTSQEPTASLVATVKAGPCQGFVIRSLPTVDGAGPDGWATEQDGVLRLVARPGMVTPEGIGIGSTSAQLQAAYAHLVGRPPGDVTAPASDTAHYEFGLLDGRVVSMALEDARFGC